MTDRANAHERTNDQTGSGWTIGDYRPLLNDLPFSEKLPLDLSLLVDKLRRLPDDTALTAAQADYIDWMWDEFRGKYLTFRDWEE